jgi:hypothetical protein
MSQPDIVKAIQKCDCWSEAYRTEDWREWYVKVYFTEQADAEAFRAEMEKAADSSSADGSMT